MLNSAGNNSFSNLVSVYLNVSIQQVLKSDFLKFRILEILNFHPCLKLIQSYFYCAQNFQNFVTTFHKVLTTVSAIWFLFVFGIT